MIDWYVVLAPLLVLAVLSLLRFVGCNQVFGIEPTSLAPPTPPMTVNWEGKIRDRVGQGKLALAPDGANDGTLTAKGFALSGISKAPLMFCPLWTWVKIGNFLLRRDGLEAHVLDA